MKEELNFIESLLEEYVGTNPEEMDEFRSQYPELASKCDKLSELGYKVSVEDNWFHDVSFGIFAYKGDILISNSNGNRNSDHSRLYVAINLENITKNHRNADGLEDYYLENREDINKLTELLNNLYTEGEADLAKVNEVAEGLKEDFASDELKDKELNGISAYNYDSGRYLVCCDSNGKISFEKAPSDSKELHAMIDHKGVLLFDTADGSAKEIEELKKTYNNYDFGQISFGTVNKDIKPSSSNALFEVSLPSGNKGYILKYKNTQPVQNASKSPNLVSNDDDDMWWYGQN